MRPSHQPRRYARSGRRARSRIMDSITLENFRCFHEKQTAQLAPLTLLVGENSTGKTSLMAMIRILWDAIHNRKGYNFNEEPFDLGTFKDIAYHSTNGEQAENFYAAFEENKYHFGVKFEKDGATPVLKRKEITKGNTSLVQQISSNKYTATLSTVNGSWQFQRQMRSYDTLEELPGLRFVSLPSKSGELQNMFEPIKGSPVMTDEDWDHLRKLDRLISFAFMQYLNKRPYASGPVRTRPFRTYDPYSPKLEHEGGHIPMYLANISLRNKQEWQHIKNLIEQFGQKSSILDRIDIKHFGDENEPFKIMIRKGGKGKTGPWRNLKDVGYGVSQILPLLTDIFRDDIFGIYLLQQPEVHLHPTAQAALATLFCQHANKNKQFIIETHSDYIIDRVRMEVRDGLIEPDNVSLLYFERVGLDVKIHSLKYDKEGNVVGAPPSYGKFFMEEVDKSIGL